MAAPVITPYPGEIPQRTQIPQVFSANVDEWLTWQTPMIPEMNTSVDFVNTKAGEADVSATDAAISAQAAVDVANYQGEWSAATGAGTKNDTYSNNGKTWRLLVDIPDITADEPVEGAVNWQLINAVNMSNVDLSVVNNPLVHLFAPNHIVKTLEGSLSSTRATTATYVDRYGVLKTAGIDELRGGEKGALIEGGSTNLILYSNDATNPYWTSLGYTATLVAAQWSPDNDVSRLTEDNGTSQRRLRRTTTTVTPSGVKTWSCIVEPDPNRQGVTMLIGGQGSGASYIVDFNLATGTFTATETLVMNTSVNMEEIREGVWRLSISSEGITPDSSVDLMVFFSNDPTNGNSTYTGDGVSGVNISALQFEELHLASSYIPTAGSPVLRAADDISAEIYGNLPLASSDWTIAGEITLIDVSVVSPTQRIFDIDSDTNFVCLLENEKLKFNIGSSPTTSVASTSNLVIHQAIKYAIVHKDGTLNLYLYGQSEDSATVDNYPTLDLNGFIYQFRRKTSGGNANGYVKNFRTFDRALNADEVKLL